MILPGTVILFVIIFVYIFIANRPENIPIGRRDATTTKNNVYGQLIVHFL